MGLHSHGIVNRTRVHGITARLAQEHYYHPHKTCRTDIAQDSLLETVTNSSLCDGTIVCDEGGCKSDSWGRRRRGRSLRGTSASRSGAGTGGDHRRSVCRRLLFGIVCRGGSVPVSGVCIVVTSRALTTAMSIPIEKGACLSAC